MASAASTSRRARRPASASKPGVERFALFCENGCGFELEPFQRRIAAEYFDGRRSLLILVPRGNGKTTLFAALALYHLLTTRNANVYVAASAIRQAEIAFEIARGFVLESPELSRLVKVQPGYRRFVRREGAGFIKVLSSDADRAHGLQPTLVLVDELHAHQNDRLFVALKTAMLKRAEAQMVTISTAGHDLDGPLGVWRQQALRLPGRTVEDRLTIVRDEASNFAMYEWACRPDDDLADPAVVKRANPASFVGEQALKEQIASTRTGELAPLEFARYHANVWTRVAEQWIPPEQWALCEESALGSPRPGEPVYVGVDASRTGDATAVAWAWRLDDGRVAVRAHVWSALVSTPAHERVQAPISLEPVERFIISLAERYEVGEVGYDERYFSRSAEILSEEGLVLASIAQQSQAMRDAYSGFFSAVMQRQLAHDGDGVLRSHVLGAAAKVAPDGWWRIRKIDQAHKIDALVAAVIASSRARAAPAPYSGPLVEVF